MSADTGPEQERHPIHQGPQEHHRPGSPAEETPGQLSRHDPDPATSNRPPVLLIIIVVLLVTGLLVLHLTGVLGPSSH